MQHLHCTSTHTHTRPLADIRARTCAPAPAHLHPHPHPRTCAPAPAPAPAPASAGAVIRSPPCSTSPAAGSTAQARPPAAPARTHARGPRTHPAQVVGLVRRFWSVLVVGARTESRHQKINKNRMGGGDRREGTHGSNAGERIGRIGAVGGARCQQQQHRSRNSHDVHGILQNGFCFLNGWRQGKTRLYDRLNIFGSMASHLKRMLSAPAARLRSLQRHLAHLPLHAVRTVHSSAASSASWVDQWTAATDVSVDR